ncbi:MAG TPA: hypothetical protein VKR52_14745 [Terracidiphilus sp.]|nr:hypothetical protein [Terracidiphilus sp.]
MTVHLLESRYAHLADSEDAQKFLGPYIHAGVATVGDIRGAVKGRAKDASIRIESDGSGFYVTDCGGKFFCG